MKKSTRRILAAAVLVGGMSVPALATDYTFNANGDGNWETTTNWTPNGFPNSVTDNATITGGTNTAYQPSPITLPNTETVKSVTFDANAFVNNQYAGQAGEPDYYGFNITGSTLDIAPSGSITLDVVNAPLINGHTQEVVPQMISSPITFSGDATITNNNSIANSDNEFINGSNDLNLAGPLTGSGTVTLNGADSQHSIIRFWKDSPAFNGNIVVNSVNLEPHPIDNTTTAPFGVGTVTMNAGSRFTSATFAYITYSNNWVIAGNAYWDSGNATIQTGNIQINTGATLTMFDGTGNAVYMQGAVSGAGTMDMVSGGEFLEGTASNTLTGTMLLEPHSRREDFVALNSLYLAKTGGAFAIAGPIDVENQGRLVLMGDEQIASNIVPTLNNVDLPPGGGYPTGTHGTGMQLRGHVQTLGGLLGTGSVENEYLGNHGPYFTATSVVPGTPSATPNGTLILDVTGSNNYTFAGTLYDDSVETYQVQISKGVGAAATGSGTLSLVKEGTGTQVLTGVNTFTGGTTVNGGILQIGAPGALPFNSALTVGAGGTLQAATHGAGPKNLLVVSSLSIAGSSGAWTGAVDLSDNDMIVRNGNLATLTNQIAQGSASGNWNGEGITSSTAAGDATFLHALGIIQNPATNTSFDGQAVSSTDVLVKYTWYGDADLSGHVDGTDYSMIDVGFNSHGSLTGWGNGDFNYDGLIDGSDYSLIDNAFNMQGLPIANAASQIAVNTAEISGASAVPEPGSLSLLVLGAAGLLGKRRRRK